jgi:hypothetical protein
MRETGASSREKSESSERKLCTLFPDWSLVGDDQPGFWVRERMQGSGEPGSKDGGCG